MDPWHDIKVAGDHRQHDRLGPNAQIHCRRACDGFTHKVPTHVDIPVVIAVLGVAGRKSAGTSPAFMPWPGFGKRVCDR